MSKKILSTTAALIGAASLLAGCSVEQPSAGCISQDATTWFALYERQGTPTPEPGSTRTAEQCATSTAGTLVGEQVGIFKFADPNNRSDTKLVLRPNALASRSTRDPGDPYMQNAVGKLGTTPDANDFCTATDFSAASVDDRGREANPGTTPPTTAIPPTRIKYEYKNVMVYAAPKAPGTQAKGEVTYTRDGCRADYTFRAVWPTVGCEPGSDIPEYNCGPGSGANPDFALECHKDLHICVPSKDIPSFKE